MFYFNLQAEVLKMWLLQEELFLRWTGLLASHEVRHMTKYSCASAFGRSVPTRMSRWTPCCSTCVLVCFPPGRFLFLQLSSFFILQYSFASIKHFEVWDFSAEVFQEVFWIFNSSGSLRHWGMQWRKSRSHFLVLSAIWWRNLRVWAFPICCTTQLAVLVLSFFRRFVINCVLVQISGCHSLLLDFAWDSFLFGYSVLMWTWWWLGLWAVDDDKTHFWGAAHRSNAAVPNEI